MNHRWLHAIEKKQVQLAAGGGLVIVYFFLWSSLGSGDPAGPVSLSARGGFAAFGLFAVILVALAGICGVLTIGSRPAGALLATLIGAGGVSLRSPSIRSLLWSHQDKLGLLFAKLIAEVLVLALLAFCAGVIISLIHWGASRLKPKGRPMSEANQPDSGGVLSPPLWATIAAAARPASARKSKHLLVSQVLLRALCCLTLGMPIAIAMILLVMKSSERGQIIFALLVSFFVAAFVAYQTFPVRSSLPAMAMVVLSAVALYGLGG